MNELKYDIRNEPRKQSKMESKDNRSFLYDTPSWVKAIPGHCINHWEKDWKKVR